MSTMFRRFVYGSTALATALIPIAAIANPLDGQVVAGSAIIGGTGTSSVTIDQSSAKAIIDWRSFNIAPGETTRFNQPDANSVTLNRVNGGLGASSINGIISANGGVYIVNPNGILFGPSSQINVGSFLATTHDIANSDFMAGHYNFAISGAPTASIINQGTITASEGGFAALVAPGVRNDGVITARLGEVDLASANSFTLDLYGDDLIKLALSDTIASDVVDVASGKTLSSLVSNTGALKSDGGKVALTASSARKVVDSVINTSGTVAADTVGTKGGLVVFGAQTAASKPSGSAPQTVRVSGTVSAKGKGPGTKGGKIQVTGEQIKIASAKIDASGNSGGGTILVGGDVMGGGAPSATLLHPKAINEAAFVPLASSVLIDSASALDVSAVEYGDAGKEVVWSTGSTVHEGAALAHGGDKGGNGGFVEVSGLESLTFSGISVALDSPFGQNGTILLDPNYSNIGPSEAYFLSSLLDRGATVIDYARIVNINSDIVKNSGPASTLKIFADSGIYIGAGVTIGSVSGRLNVILDSDATYNTANLWSAGGMRFPGADYAYPGPSRIIDPLDPDHRIRPQPALIEALSYAFNRTLEGNGYLPQIAPGSDLLSVARAHSSVFGSFSTVSSFHPGIGSMIYTSGGTLDVYDNINYTVLSDGSGNFTQDIPPSLSNGATVWNAVLDHDDLYNFRSALVERRSLQNSAAWSSFGPAPLAVIVENDSFRSTISKYLTDFLSSNPIAAKELYLAVSGKSTRGINGAIVDTAGIIQSYTELREALKEPNVSERANSITKSSSEFYTAVMSTLSKVLKYAGESTPFTSIITTNGSIMLGNAQQGQEHTAELVTATDCLPACSADDVSKHIHY